MCGTVNPAASVCLLFKVGWGNFSVLPTLITTHQCLTLSCICVHIGVLLWASKSLRIDASSILIPPVGVVRLSKVSVKTTVHYKPTSTTAPEKSKNKCLFLSIKQMGVITCFGIAFDLWLLFVCVCVCVCVCVVVDLFVYFYFCVAVIVWYAILPQEEAVHFKPHRFSLCTMSLTRR